MSSISREQRDVLALIDAIMAMTEKAPKYDSLSVGLSLNPFNFLMDIIMKYVSFEDMVDWLVDVLTVTLPTIELSVKGILLANLKATIDCNNDPRIPNWLRKNGTQNEGFLFDLGAIDFKNMMAISPLSPEGSAHYFGTKTYFTIDGDKESGKKYISKSLACGSCAKQGILMNKIKKHSECDNVYKLARANDFNAFLWFVVNKCYFGEPSEHTFTSLMGVITGNTTITDDVVAPYSPGNIVVDGDYVSLCIEGNVEEIKNQYSYTNQEILSGDNNIERAATNFLPRSYSYKFVPFSSDSVSANWYINSGTFFNFLKKEEDRVERDYEKDYAICNFRYYDKKEFNGINHFNCLHFTILRKPQVHLPTKDEPIWRVKPILFDKDGNPDPKGRFSAEGVTLNEDGSYNAVNTTSLYECYPRLTVYEFNYDFVMGMKLFDPTVVAAQLIETVMNIKYMSGVNVGAYATINKSETAYQMRIAEIVKNIVESTAYEVSDCFYSFDNSKYDSMLREAELKRSRMHVDNDGNNRARECDANEVYDILNEFDNNATLNENKEVIKRAITQATASITEEVLPEDKYSIQFNIVEDLIRTFIFILVETLITPKIVLLFEINRAMMGQDYTKYNIEDFLKSINGLLVSIIRELRDLILQKLLDWCLKILMDLNVKAIELLLKEQLEYYSRLMKLLFKACTFRSKKRKLLDSELDDVDYADIEEIERPQESNC